VISLQKLLNNTKEKTVLVVGDSILDVSVYSEAIGLSLETPTLKVKKIKSTKSMGGAANVVKNCIALGSQCHFITVLGEDEIYPEYSSWMDNKLAISAIIEERENVSKTRHWIKRGDCSYKHLQINTGDKTPITKNSEDCIINLVEEIVESFDALLLIDYQNGVFSSKEFTQKIIEIAKSKNISTICNSQKSTNKARHDWFAGADLISMNLEEAVANDKDFVSNQLSNLENKFSSGVCVTLGESGSVIKGKNHDKEYSCDALKIEVKDSCGAGDAFLACLSLLDWHGAPQESLAVSNTWAALSINKLGLACPTKRELIELIKVLDNETDKNSNSAS
jgi:rfaE bifunctional protein kinase chain/domain